MYEVIFFLHCTGKINGESALKKKIHIHILGQRVLKSEKDAS